MKDSNANFRPPSSSGLLSWRGGRLALFALLCLITLGALFYAEEDVRGKRAWNAYAREQVAKGEKLTVGEFIPPAIPDEQNLALCPVLKPILDFQFITEGTTLRVASGEARWRDTNGLKRLQRLNRSQSVSDYHNQLPAKERNQSAIVQAEKMREELEKPPTMDNWIDLSGWQSYYRTGTNLAGIAPTNSPARDVLLALRHLEPDLAELQQEAQRRPLARWAVFYETNFPWGILLPHLARVKSLSALLELHSAARLAAGETEGGLADIELGFRLAETVRDESFIISQLVRQACHQLVLQPVREGLARHQFSDAQLARLQQMIGGPDLLASFQQSIRAERAASSEWTLMTKRGRQAELRELFGTAELQRQFDLSMTFVRWAPVGWVYRGQLDIFQLYDRFAFPAVNAEAKRVYPEVAEAGRTAVHALKWPWNLLPRFCFPDTSRSGRRFARSQTRLNQAVIACALERYRLAHGVYPATLASLAPQFAAKIPEDLISGQPMKYELVSDGQYLLSAHGWDESPDREGIQTFLGYDSEKGDWLWRLPSLR